MVRSGSTIYTGNIMSLNNIAPDFYPIFDNGYFHDESNRVPYLSYINNKISCLANKFFHVTLFFKQMNGLICLTFIFGRALMFNWISITFNRGGSPYKKFVFMLITP